ncbi:MAG: NAD(P)-dependent oxidoreductase [Deltaproteobacteria bacterium]|jgi:nucleoside-diphosphate-sugar epimerase|nr:NAD(P)-dependent oxidoreductase [Deltaproteobacteria bacterium]
MPSPKKTLIAGGAGYLGLTLARALLASGREVTILDSLLHGLPPALTSLNVNFLEGDIRDISLTHRALQGFDEVVDLAALVGEPACDASPAEANQVNYLAAANLAAAAETAGVQRFILASTDSCYGARENEKLTELSPLAPLSLYARTKAWAEAAILSRPPRPDFQPTVLRMATIYGLADRTRFDLAVNLLTREATLKKRIKIFSGEQWRPLVHVADAARAFVLALDAPPALVSGQIFNVGSNEQNVQFKDLGALIAKVIPETVVETIPEPPDLRDYWVDFDKIRLILRFQPKYSLKAGILELRKAIIEGQIPDPYAAWLVNYPGKQP